jgi:hypothetical protein
VKPAPKTIEDKLMEAFSNWKTAEATYYDPMDSTQTKKNPDGKGTLGRLISSGSISLDSSIVGTIQREELEVFIEVLNLKIMTPYGKGIFRVDDSMPGDYSGKNHFHIDFFQDDLDSRHLRQGRFKVKFRICKIIKTAGL